MTEDFLKFTKSKGNDLMKPNPKYQFPGLKSGDKWCLCALRWEEARKRGHAPEIIKESTHEKTHEFIDPKLI